MTCPNCKRETCLSLAPSGIGVEAHERLIDCLEAQLATAREDAGRLAEALNAVIHDRPSAHSDAVWGRIQAALDAHAKVTP